MYAITSNQKMIGTIEETPTSSKNIGNHLLKLLSLSTVAGVELRVLDGKANVVGTIKKEKGFYKEFLLISSTNQLLATIKPTVRVKSPSITVIDGYGNTLIHAIGRNGATDFSVTDTRTNKHISTIRRRSLVYKTVKENLLNDDGYFIDHTNQENFITLCLLAIGITIDMNFFIN